MLKEAFNLIIQLQKEDCDILTKSGVAINGVAIARSNLNRKLQAIEDSTYEGGGVVIDDTGECESCQ